MEPKKSFLLCLTFLSSFFLIFTHSTAIAATIHVPADQPTIQAGIDAAGNGDTVLVADGTYTGEGNHDINFNGKAITVKSENGPENCIVDCEDYAVEGFRFDHDETETSILDGFTVTRTNIVDSAAIYAEASPKIIDCHVVNNNNDGMYFQDGQPTILNCDISGNSGNGIHLSHFSSTVFEKIEIRNCNIRENGKWGLWLWDVNNCNNFNIINCTISFNGSSGICSNYSNVHIEKCDINNNGNAYITGADGIELTDNSNTTILECSINFNRYGIKISNSSPKIEKCKIQKNQLGLILFSGSNPIIQNCLITNNEYILDGAGIRSEYDSCPTIINSTIANNITTHDDYGGVYIRGNSLIKNTIIWGNTPSSNFINGDKVYFSDVEGYLNGGEGNIDQDPLFVGSEDFNLQENSPCIDKGTASGAPNTDIDGITRPQGLGYDMGAYEKYVAPAAPTVFTTAVSTISENSAVSGGNVTSPGSKEVTARGVCWSTSSNPTTSDDHTLNGTGTGTFTSNLTGLNSESNYHVRAYATNSVGTGYGNDITFSTCPNCSGDVVELTNKTFPVGGKCECVGTTSMKISSDVTIPKDCEVTFKSKKVEVEPDFHAESGSVVKMEMLK